MALFLVKWEIEVDADTAVEAAKIAHDIQLDIESNAMFFDVAERGTANNAPSVVVDLDNLPTPCTCDPDLPSQVCPRYCTGDCTPV